MPLWPFGNKPFLDGDDEDWQAETWGWFLRQFGGLADLRRSPLVAPTRSFFPPSEAIGHERAEHIFALVKAQARLADWECQLIAQERRPDARVGEVMALKLGGGLPAGTFGVQGNRVTITYDPAALDDPAILVATLAHELCHYRLAALGELPPGGEETVEFATDLATVYCGFGLFGASAAFNFQQHGDSFSQGWRWSRLGYLDRRAWCYALAIFFRLRDEPIEQAKPYLKPHLFSDLRAAAAYLSKHPEKLPDPGS